MINYRSRNWWGDFDAMHKAVKEEIQSRLDGVTYVRLCFWGGFGDTFFDLEVHRGFNKEEKVKGKHLGDMVDEICRRHGFVDRQAHLQLTIQQPSTIPEAVVEEIPERPEAPPIQSSPVGIDDSDNIPF